jgi:hypothetical protein
MEQQNSISVNSNYFQFGQLEGAPIESVFIDIPPFNNSICKKDSKPLNNGLNYINLNPTCPVNYFNNLIYKLMNNTEYIILYPFIIENKKNSVKEKFCALKKILKNVFISNENKKCISDLFCKLQKVYLAFSKLAFLYKYNKSSIKIDKDLCWNDITQCQKNTILLYQNNAKYLFTLHDLINIIETALTNSPDFESKPLECKNPFNNVPFTIANLYTIYIALKESKLIMSTLIHQFFLCEFDLKLFLLENEFLIREIAIQKYIHNTSNDILYHNVINMISSNNNRIIIDSEFPKNVLVETMKPYLYLYIIYIHHIEGVLKKRYAKILLKKLLRKFYQFNPQFGKKKFIKWNNNRYKKIFVTEHPPFTMYDLKKIKYNIHLLDDSIFENPIFESSQSIRQISVNNEIGIREPPNSERRLHRILERRLNPLSQNDELNGFSRQPYEFLDRNPNIDFHNLRNPGFLNNLVPVINDEHIFERYYSNYIIDNQTNHNNNREERNGSYFNEMVDQNEINIDNYFDLSDSDDSTHDSDSDEDIIINDVSSEEGGQDDSSEEGGDDSSEEGGDDSSEEGGDDSSEEGGDDSNEEEERGREDDSSEEEGGGEDDSNEKEEGGQDDERCDTDEISSKITEENDSLELNLIKKDIFTIPIINIIIPFTIIIKDQKIVYEISIELNKNHYIEFRNPNKNILSVFYLIACLWFILS